MTPSDHGIIRVDLKDACVSSPDQVRGAGQTGESRFRRVSPPVVLRISSGSRPRATGVIASRSLAESHRPTRRLSFEAVAA